MAIRITRESQLDDILGPIAEGVGEPVGNSDDYDWLDEQMMRVGSLQHGDMDWAGAEDRAVRLLTEQGKDLRVLGHLLHCLQQGGDPVRFALSLHLLAGSLEHWWAEAYPAPGAKGNRMRGKLFQQFTQRGLKLAAALDFAAAEAELEACRQALQRLREQAVARELSDQALIDLARLLEQTDPDADAAAASTGRHDTRQASTSRQTAAPATDSDASEPARAPEMRLESGNERANRQSLIKMAEFLNDQSPGDPLGYRLRRYAIWHTIQTLPMSRADGRTDLAPVSADRVAAYREALAGRPSLDEWRRIENSLALSPYWLEGHRLSAEMARRLEHEGCAEAIRDEVRRFVDRLPGLDGLTFSDGTAFLDDATRQWLASATDNSPTGASLGAGGDPWQEGLETARERLQGEGLGAALAVLDEGLAAAGSPRERVYWRLASADLLRDAGLEAMARQHYQALHDAVSGIHLDHWEPALPQRLQALSEGAS
ncbi:type VI secretion system protein TssA [Halomonas sabkhae]|uniref:type VI secretion system protein TssA n=1 Tax=Halomonas sabkhae TaxID=626223 RepID=UPI0025B506AA|nr:type VI secretion system protein TssA [Halomonas sabkhae]MDN3524957.1 type VI secretion system protein TssA [Halomonas sabkhae]